MHFTKEVMNIYRKTIGLRRKKLSLHREALIYIYVFVYVFLAPRRKKGI